jgi:hypothetical protein
MDSESATKFATACKTLQKASLKCLEEKQLQNSTLDCQIHFDNYKKCIKDEHNSIIEERRKKGAWIQ